MIDPSTARDAPRGRAAERTGRDRQDRPPARGSRSGSCRSSSRYGGCAIFKSAICLADPHDRGPRNQLNLGHTFAHALEAAAGYELSHGRAVALGLLAALRLTGSRRRDRDRPSASSRPSPSGSTAMRPGPRFTETRRRRAEHRGWCCSTPPARCAGVSRYPRRSPRRAGYAHRMTGRCLCGGVKFELDPPLREILVCHCSLCRRAGTLAGAYTEVRRARFTSARATRCRGTST